MDIDQTLAQLEKLNTDIENAYSRGDHPSAHILEQQFFELESSIDPTALSQDQFVRLLDIYRRAAWDIPSALAALCPDYNDAIPMHRDFDRYPEHRPLWDHLDTHFEEAHDLDLTDSRINWSFDT